MPPDYCMQTTQYLYVTNERGNLGEVWGRKECSRHVIMRECLVSDSERKSMSDSH